MLIQILKLASFVKVLPKSQNVNPSLSCNHASLVCCNTFSCSPLALPKKFDGKIHKSPHRATAGSIATYFFYQFLF